MVTKVAKKCEDELALLKVEKEKMDKDFEELKTKYEYFQENDGKMTQLNQDYRDQLVGNENMMT